MKALSVVVLTLAAALVSAAPVFAGGTAEQPKRGAGLKIALVVKNKDDAYQGIQQGSLAAAKDLGNVDVIFQGPATPTAAAQAEIIDELVSQKVDAIVVSPSEVGQAIDPLLRALKKAVDAGIKVVSLNQTIAAGGPLLDVQSPTEENVGRNLVKVIAKQVGESGEIGILSASPDAAYQNSVIDGMKKELSAHPNIRLDAIFYGNGLADKSARETATLMRTYPNVKGIIAPTPVGLAAAGKALEAAKLGGKVQLTGLGIPADMKPYFDTGTCTQILLETQITVGYVVTYVAALLARGQTAGHPGENLKLGRMGAISISETGKVPMPSPAVITKDTIASFENTQSN